MGARSNDDIEWLIALAERADLAELEVTCEGSSVLVRRGRAPTVAALAARGSAPEAPPAEAAGLVPVLATMTGVFYRSPTPDSPQFVEEGDEVQAGETVGLIEAMKLYNDIDAPCAGRVERILAPDASRVAADQVLMYLRPLEG